MGAVELTDTDTEQETVGDEGIKQALDAAVRAIRHTRDEGEEGKPYPFTTWRDEWSRTSETSSPLRCDSGRRQGVVHSQREAKIIPTFRPTLSVM